MLKHVKNIHKNYDIYATLVWLCAFIALGFMLLTSLSFRPIAYGLLFSGILCIACAIRAFQYNSMLKRLKYSPIKYITHQNLFKKMKKDNMWLGEGFDWKNTQAQIAHEILNKGIDFNEEFGLAWVQGISKSQSKFQPLHHTDGHSIIFGATGAGKTRLFDLLIAQAILRDETVIIIDPKGDQDLCRNTKESAILANRLDKFVMFHPAYPHLSIRIDPLSSFSRIGELASRITSLISSNSGDAFRDFAWQSLNNIVQGLNIIGEKPTLINIRSCLEDNLESLVKDTILAYGQKILKEKFTNLAKAQTSTQDYIKLYYKHIAPIKQSIELEGLIATNNYDKVYFAKMTATLRPILNKLTTGDIGSLLSPNPETLDKRSITSIEKIIANQQILYLGLDSLTDASISSAIGSIMIADLAATAGNRYNYGKDLEVVNIFVDEACEVLNEPFIQLLNKGRGAKFRLFIAAQTLPDFIAKLGNEAKAYQIIGNINNIYVLRITDPKTINFISSSFPKVQLTDLTQSFSHTTSNETPIDFQSKYAENLAVTNSELVPSSIFNMLPNLEYIAKISGGRIIKAKIPIIGEKNG